MGTELGHSLRSEHEALRATLKRAMREPGRTGEAARKLASVADGHFLREEKFVLPLLAMLPALSRARGVEKRALAARLLEGLKAEMEQMIADHRVMAELLRELARVAEAEQKPDYVAFAEEMILHAHAEEEVHYPAALVAGEYVKLLSG
jgi:hypothetical protein